MADGVGHRVPGQYFAIGILIEILLPAVAPTRPENLPSPTGNIVPNAVVYPDFHTVHSELLLALGQHRA
ncbi:hypothetical protein ACIQMR_31690 [Streptomyces sp. NPDC091376]|uniref:hypothetical protein n=1 Tax=Streptomyces sp. NPDC091376 TaxID=3365994 RepID=UPI0037FB639E